MYALPEATKRSLLGSLFALSFSVLTRLVRRVLSLLFGGLLASIFLKRWRAGRKARKAITKLKDGQRVLLRQPALVEHDRIITTRTTEDEKLADRFLSMASHELKTPMTTIRGHAQFMLRKLSRLPDKSADLTAIQTSLERIDWQTQRLSRLVDELLDLNTIRTGKTWLDLDMCNLVDICQEAVEEQRLLTGRAIEFEAPETLLLAADAKRLNQVLVNLVSNAARYTPQERLIRVRVAAYNNAALIEVCDNGPGIPGDQLEHVFEPFYRGPDVQESPISGLGLGLTICKEIVDRHGGHIWCDSIEGKGTVFSVALPMP